MIRKQGLAPTSKELEATILSLSPQGYWKLDETSGTTATDSSGNARHGTYTGTIGTGYTLATVPGIGRRNYVNVGTSTAGYIAVADNNVWSANAASGLSIFGLVKPAALGVTANRYIIAKGAASNHEWGLIQTLSPANTITANVWAAAGTNMMSSTAADAIWIPSSDGWLPVAMTLATPAAAGLVSIFNGSARDRATNTSGSGSYTNGSAAVWIGYRSDSPANAFFQGGLAHFAIFSGQLSTANVERLMLAARGT